ncbi:MAG TPA: hypothetical protein VGB85_25765, partial [Nannocystis sp.]
VDLDAGAFATIPGPGTPAIVAASKQHTPSPDGRIVAAVHERERLVIWDREDGSVRSVRLPAKFTFHSIEFAEDARTLVMHSSGERVLVWRDDGTTRVIDAGWATFAGETLLLLGSAERGLKLWAEPITGGPPLWSRSLSDEFPASRAWRPFMAGAHGLARVQLAGRWEVFDFRTGAVRYARAGNYDEPLLLGHGEQILLTAPGEDAVHRLQLLDLSRSPWTPLAPLAASGGIVRTALSASARFAVRQHLKSRVVERLDLTRGVAEPLPAGCGAWTSDPLLLAAGDDGRVLLADNQFHACLWSGDVTYPLPVSQGFVSGMALAPDGAGFAIAIADNTLFSWDRPDAEPRRGAGTQMKYSPDGEYMVVLADPDVTILPRSGAPIALPKLGGAHGITIAISPDSRQIALHTRTAGAVHLVDARDGKTVRTFDAPPPIDLSTGGQGPRFSPSGRVLALADGDRMYRWDIDGSPEPVYLDRVGAVGFAFTADEQALLAIDNYGNLLLVDPIAGVQTTLRSESSRGAPPWMVAMPDGAVLMTTAGEVLRWQDMLPARGDALRGWLRASAAALAP